MKWKLSFVVLFALLVGSIHLTLWAEEPKETAKAKDDTATVKASKQFMNTSWKKIQKKTFEVQKATTVAGVRGAEAEDEVLNRLYYKGSGKEPTRKQLKDIIDVLQKSVDENPKASDIGETKLYIAQCYTLLGNTDEATKLYNEIIKESPDSEWATSAKKELGRLTKGK
ncbi:MAG: tetratricopeptide repeat protein [Candidatus Latescibacteria bacterium]|nr:tetratricopeptide repeat protein [Candidatus Latescibacterota bacterium]